MGGISPASAVQPVTLDETARVEWSKVVETPFDGKIVYDKNFNDNLVFVSSWSQNGIRATFTQFQSEFAGYRTIWRSRSVYYGHGKRRYERYADQEPVYRRFATTSTPRSLQFAINGQIYTYNEGAISPELSAALASAPAKNMLIRLVWENGRTQDIEIGKGTVEAWKTIFKTVEASVPCSILDSSGGDAANELALTNQEQHHNGHGSNHNCRHHQ